MPVSYPWVMTWATVPTVLLLLAVIGIGLAVVGDLRLSTPDTATAQRPTFFSPLPVDWNRHDGALLLIMAAFPLVLISLPTTPIFGGTKHFFPAYPFLALGAATAWGWLWKRAAIGRRKRWLQPVALAACLGPGIIATVDGHPYNLSQYAPFAGGPRGAANMGLARGFWGHAVPALFPTVHEALPRGGAVYLHDLHDAAREQYEREGVWRPEDRSAAIPQADAGLLFYERHMTTYEVQLWGAMGTTSPSGMIVLDDVPLTSLYVSDR
jgi:hypothetical protein